jgi:hypothetical protein
MVGLLMSVGVMTVGVMSAGEIIVGVMTVGVMRPRGPAKFLITGHKHSFIEFRPLPGRRRRRNLLSVAGLGDFHNR